LIKRVSVTYTCYEMYAHRVLRSSSNGRYLINYRHCLRSLPNRH
jgi:hypothetical protein